MHGVAGWVHGVAREAVVHLHVHALQQAVHAAAPTHEPTHAPIAAMGAERREPMLGAVSWAAGCGVLGAGPRFANTQPKPMG